MNDFFLGSPDNSMNAVNRFWIIDPKAAPWGLTTAPTVTMSFVDDDAQDIDMVGATPGVDKDMLVVASTPIYQAQRFNPGLNKWGDYQSQPASAWSPNTPSAGRSTVSGWL